MKKIYRIATAIILAVIFNFLSHNTLQASPGTDSLSVDTTYMTLCVTSFPMEYLGEEITAPGEYTITLRTTDSRDSAVWWISVFQSYIDTINLKGCVNEFPLVYDDLTFSEATRQMVSVAQDSNGCDIFHYFVVDQLPVYYDTTYASICAPEAPYFFQGDTLTESGWYEHAYSAENGCDSIFFLSLMIYPDYEVIDTLIETVCSHYMPFVVGDSTFYEPGVYDFTLNSEFGCDSAYIHLELDVLPTTYDTTYYTFCENDFPIAIDSVRTFEEPGIYYLESGDSIPCMVMDMLIVQSSPSYNDTIVADICATDTPYVFADTAFTSSVTYTFFGTTTQLCDSNITLVLNVWEAYTDTLRDTLVLCQYDLPYTYRDTVIDHAGTYYEPHTTTFGCDSTCNALHVIVREVPQDTVAMAVCENMIPFQYRDTLISEVGEYDLVLPDTVTFGCDTLRHLVVTTLPVYHDSLDIAICENETFAVGDSILTEPGIYDIMLQSIAGCDSLITVNLIHYPVYQDDTLYFTTCEYNLPFNYAGQSFTTPGTHEIRLTTVNGCDSIVPIHLTIWPIIYNTDTIREEICASQLPYTTAFGVTVNGAGSYTFSTTSRVTGCDSIFYYRLTVHSNPIPTITGSQHLCVGSSTQLTASGPYAAYSWNNGASSQVITINAANTYRVTVTDQHNCRGTASFTVVSAPLPTMHLSSTQAICKGASATITVSGADHYLWDNASTEASITVYPTATTTYHVTAYTVHECQREGNVTVVVHELPVATITGPDAVCQGNSCTWIATGGTSYAWSTNSTNDRITVNTENSYTVTVTDAHNCRNTATKTLIVNALPTVAINGRTPFCQGESTTLTASGAVNYSWSTGETTPSITTTYANTYSVTGTDANGCTSSASKQITLWQVSAQIVGARNFCQGGHTTLSVTGNETYTYHWNDGSTASSLDIYTPGTYSVSVTNSLGCTNAISANVSEMPSPTPSITGTTTVCQGRTAILRANGGNSYVWGDGTTNAYFSTTQTGTYFVTVTNAQGCSATTSETVIVNPLPEVTISANNNICNGESVSLFAFSTTGMQYSWPMSGQQGQLITVAPTNTSTYTVLVTDENGCSNTASTTINVQNNPTPYLNGPSEICQGGTAVLTALGGSSYQWSNGLTSSSINVSQSGTYTVTVSNTYGCTASTSTSLTVNPLPSITLTPDTAICQGESVLLTAIAPAGCSYIWSNGSTQNQITVSSTGTYQVSATNANGCTNSRSVHVTVHPRPQISIAGNTAFCDGGSTVLTANNEAGSSYTWSTGVSNAPLTVSAPGTYTVTAANSHGCTQTASTSVTMYTLPNAAIIGAGTICANAATTLYVNNSSHYAWSTGDTTHTITVAPAISTAYSVTVTDEHGCQNSSSAVVSISSTVTVSISGELSFCQGGSTQLTASPGYCYLWSNNATTPSITVTQPGIYKVTASNTLGCSAVDSVLVTVNPLPVLHFGMQHAICAGQSYTYQLPNNELTYHWSTGATGNQLTVSAQGIYTVTATNSHGCQTTARDSLIISPLPTPSITGNTTVCRGSSTILTATGGLVYQWSNGSVGADVALFPNSNNTYTVTATNEYGCSATASTYVTVNSLPTINFLGNTTFCEGSSTTISASGATSYLWSTGATTNTITVNTPGTYSVRALNAFGCSRTDSITVFQAQNPNIYINGDNLVCANTLHTLTATGALSYVWSTGENTPSISILPTSTTTYEVTGTDANGCVSSVSKVVNVEPQPNVLINGNNTICLGDSVVFTATGGQYYLWSTGSTADHITISASGNYTVTATSANGCTAATSAELHINPSPIAQISGPNTLCNNSTAQLVARGGTSYIWSNGSIDSVITISMGGNYTVTATNPYGCTSTASLQVTTLEAPFVFLNSVSSVCQGGSSNILSYSNAASYLWSTGETTQNITVTPTASTTYVLTATHENGCVSSDSIRITVLPTFTQTFTDNICQGSTYSLHGFQLPAQTVAGTFTFTNNLQSIHGCDSTIILNLTVNPIPVLPATISGNEHLTSYGTFVYDVDSTLYATNYEWRVSNTNWTITGGNQSSILLTVNVNGSGLLTAKAINSCGSVERSLAILCNVGVEEYTNETQIRLYPVPTHDVLNIDLSEATHSIGQVCLVDALGRTLQTLTVTDSHLQLDCSTLAAGHYFVRFLDSKGGIIDNRKIIVNR